MVEQVIAAGEPVNSIFLEDSAGLAFPQDGGVRVRGRRGSSPLWRFLVGSIEADSKKARDGRIFS